MIVAAAGELQGAVPQLSSCWPLFPGLLKGIKRSFPWKSRISSLDSAAFSSRVKKKKNLCWYKTHRGKKWKKMGGWKCPGRAGGKLPSLPIPAGFCAGRQNLTHFYKKNKFIFKQEKNAKLSPACGYAFIKGGPFHLVYILYVHIIKKVFLSLCVCLCRFINLIN